MAVKQPADYAEHLAVVMQIINRLNTRRRKSDHLQIEVELEDDVTDDATDDNEVAIGA
jgi:hypothetical protein